MNDTTEQPGRWVNEKDFHKLDAIDQVTCAQILRWKDRHGIDRIVRLEPDGTHSVNMGG